MLFNQVIPFVPIVEFMQPMARILILKQEGYLMEKISYERRVYESVDDKILSQAVSQNLTKKSWN